MKLVQAWIEIHKEELMADWEPASQGKDIFKIDPLKQEIFNMNPRVIEVKPKKNYTLLLTFTNKEIRLFDVKPYLDKGIFKQLKDLKNFDSVKPFLSSIQWYKG